MGYYYILNKNNTPIKCNKEEHEDWFTKNSKNIFRDEIDGVLISTIFLGYDCGFGGNSLPCLFETMIFNLPDSDYDHQERYTFFEDAKEGHKKAIDIVINYKNKQIDWGD